VSLILTKMSVIRTKTRVILTQMRASVEGTRAMLLAFSTVPVQPSHPCRPW
jgi:hypothetical protein